MGHSRWCPINRHILSVAGWLSIFTLGGSPVWGQITPIGTTVISTEGTQTQITGGTSSIDGTNLFHQFDDFNVSADQTVTFVTPDTVSNILGRISGGQASLIDGSLSVSNDASLWLLNPAGILFGPNAQLNLQGDFSAATANAIGFEQDWFDGANSRLLTGPPTRLGFASNPGYLINLGDLQVASGQNLRLLGGSVMNAGTLSAPDGTITLVAVTDNTRQVNPTQTDPLLTLSIEPWSETGLNSYITPASLPEMLTGRGEDSANTLITQSDGTAWLMQTAAATPTAGHITVSGTVSSAGGQVALLGDQISLLDAHINTDSPNQGGRIYVGGSYQGMGPLSNATNTQVDRDTILSANAIEQGDGGQIIVWSDEATYFSGHVRAQGGDLGGDGGFIEISGKSHLEFGGQFSLRAPHGESGTILFDPDNIRIVGGGTLADVAAESLLFPAVNAIDKDFGTLTLHEATLESWSGDDNIILQANRNIWVDLGGNNELTFQPGTGSIQLIADADNNLLGSFTMNEAGDLINTSGRDIEISGATINLQSIDTHLATAAGNLALSAPILTSVAGDLDADAITVRTNELNLNGGNNSIRGTTLLIEPNNPAIEINVGPDTNTLFDLDLLETDVLALQDGFTTIAIGRADGTGMVTLYDSITDGGTTPFRDPVTILGANTLKGPDKLTPWVITDTNQGNINGLFSNGLRFENIDSIAVSNSTNDTIQGAANNDTIILSGLNAGTFNETNFAEIQRVSGGGGDDRFVISGGLWDGLDGGPGTDTLDYSTSTIGVTVDLENNTANNVIAFSNIESFIGGSGSDTFRVSANAPASLIDGGAGDNALIGDNTASTWTLTGVDRGYGTGVNNFIRIQNLVAGNQSDQITILNSAAGFTGDLDGGAGPLIVRGDNINLGTATTGTEELIIEPISSNRDIQLGGFDNPSALTISTSEFATIYTGFTGITIGNHESAGNITLGADVTLPSSITILTPQGAGTIDTQGFNLTASQLALLAAQDITTATLTAPAGISISSGGAIDTQDIFTSGDSVVLDAAATITTRQIDTTGTIGGDITLNATDMIQVESLRAEGDAAGGDIALRTENFLRLTDGFTSLDGYAASISTAATNGTGDITIYHGGNSSTPFNVGDSDLLGSHDAITSGDFQIDINNAFLNSYVLGNISLLTQDTISPPAISPPAIPLSPSSLPLSISSAQAVPYLTATAATAVSNSSMASSSSVEALQPPLVNNSLSFPLDEPANWVQSDTANGALFEQLENSFSNQFKSHLNLYERVSISSPSLASAQQTLGNIETSMGIKPGVLYIYFRPSSRQNMAQTNAESLSPDDELELLLLTHGGQPIRRRVKGVTREAVMDVAKDFSSQITNAISVPSQYLPPAQQLYRWFIAPIEQELQQQGIQSLALAMDTGLRTLPVAALHSGSEFLVERYSLGIIPSFSLTNFNPEHFLYTQLEDTQLLAMGASQFASHQRLPAVLEELEIVTQTFHASDTFLNDSFTLNNLKTQITNDDYGIIHLASHGVFEPGKPQNSYIQLWDQPLQLNQVHTLGLQDADIALMVLSACNTALGDREAEYGFAGLAVNAGVQTSIASLWPISDEGTLGLMTYFYASLLQQPARANALQQAQLAMLHGELQFIDGRLYDADQNVLAQLPELEYHGRWNFEHPYYWSTYTLIGSPW
ncbi:MAG: CHAT domain-containing protein [Cyanobacteria bacterium P01_H01_bin.21]